MTKRQVWDIFGWGFMLWLIGYVLGFILFFALPPRMIGWVIMPIGVVITLWVLLKKIKDGTFHNYVRIAVVWTALAVVLDYFFIVEMLHPADGYYKPDVYLYYALTFALPLVVGWRKSGEGKINK